MSTSKRGFSCNDISFICLFAETSLDRPNRHRAGTLLMLPSVLLHRGVAFSLLFSTGPSVL